MVWVGGNDFLAKRNPLKIIDNIVEHIERLVDAGAKWFFVPNLPSLMHAPRGQDLVKGIVEGVMEYMPESFEPVISSIVASGIHGGVYLYNWLLEKRLESIRDLRSVTIYYLDVFSMFNEVIEDLEGYGFSRKADLFYDDLHPNVRGHELIADAALEVLGDKKE